MYVFDQYRRVAAQGAPSYRLVTYVFIFSIYIYCSMIYFCTSTNNQLVIYLRQKQVELEEINQKV